MGDTGELEFLTPLTTEESPIDLLPGTRMGKYEIQRRVSVGGMAEIFLARAQGLPGFEKHFAIKRILPHLAAKADFVEMFLDEARLAATLHHPNIVQIYDVCVSGGSYFAAMEYLHGEDLRSLLRESAQQKRAIPLELALQIEISLLGGLHYAHEKQGSDGKPLQIVHRDVSPGNVFVTYEGDVKLLDFGIARAETQRPKTRSGTAKGKVGYLSPEECQGQPIDRRADIFAAAILLYELTMGRRLYQGSDYQVMKDIVEGSVTPPRQLDPTYDERLQQIVLKGLTRDPAKRYQTAREFQLDLEKLARARGMYFSANTLKQFMGELFAAKLASRQALLVAKGAQLAEEPPVALEPDPVEAGAQSLVERPRTKAYWLAAAAAVVVLGAGATWTRLHRSPPAPAVAKGATLSSTRSAPRGDPEAPMAANVPTPAKAAEQVDTEETADLPEPTDSAHPEGTAPSALRSNGHSMLKIATHPHNAEITLDGKRVTTAQPVTADVKAGDHVVVATLAGYKETVKHIHLKSGQRSALTLSLARVVAEEPAPEVKPTAKPAAEPTGQGMLAITSSPWCDVEIDGTARGQTPVSISLSAGKHSVTLTNAEFKIRRQIAVQITPNETLRKRLDFAK